MNECHTTHVKKLPANTTKRDSKHPDSKFIEGKIVDRSITKQDTEITRGSSGANLGGNPLMFSQGLSLRLKPAAIEDAALQTTELARFDDNLSTASEVNQMVDTIGECNSELGDTSVLNTNQGNNPVGRVDWSLQLSLI